MTYLSDGSWNTKTKKNLRKTLILYLSPHKKNSLGRNLCPNASSGCIESCLFTAGRGVFKNVMNARMNRTEKFLSDRRGFLNSIAQEINSKAKRNSVLAVRLNGTSDIKLVEMLTSSHDIADNVVFYDYTKIKQKSGRRVLDSGHTYVVTFSRSESNEHDAIDVLNSGGIVAVVFSGELPKYWRGFRVVDGDERDDLMLDVRGAVVLGLKSKGKARYDESGFVVHSTYKPKAFSKTSLSKKHLRMSKI